MKVQPKTITLANACKVYGAGNQMLYRLVHDGTLHGEKVGRNIFLRVKELDRLFYGID